MSVNVTTVSLTFPFEGFGTALAWWANAGIQQPALDYLLQLLYSPSGVNFSIARFNIGGTQDATKNPNFRAGANVPADAAGSPQLSVVQRIVALRSGLPLHIEAFSNSPPQNLTISGSSAGASKSLTDCITATNVQPFAQFLMNSVQFLISSGVPVETLSPINEPSEVVWVQGNNQEGCFWGKDNRIALATGLKALLSRSGTGVKLALADENNPGAAIASSYFLSYGDLLNVHTYTANQFSNGTLVDAVAASQDTDDIRANLVSSFQATSTGGARKIVMSEFTFGGNFGSSDIQSVASHAFGLIRHIVRDVVTLKTASWVYWQAVENQGSNSNWGLMQVPFDTAGDTSSVVIGAQYHGMWMLSRVLTVGTTTFEQYYDSSRVVVSNAAVGSVLFANGGDATSTSVFWFPQQAGQFNVTRLQTVNGVATLSNIGIQNIGLGGQVSLPVGTVELWVGSPSAQVKFPANATVTGTSISTATSRPGSAVEMAGHPGALWTLVLSLIIILMLFKR
ncbi:hypothetical protein HDU93_007862 [Gonapodya sp. JEL0774]|nr:hypothetical protein HDU93_007862 [Gonapodya sp. JEL0774]